MVSKTRQSFQRVHFLISFKAKFSIEPVKAYKVTPVKNFCYGKYIEMSHEKQMKLYQIIKTG